MKTLLLLFSIVLMILIPITGNAQVQLYPNPVTGNEFTLVSPEKMNKVEIYNILGEKIFELQCFDYERKFEIPDLNSGIYLVKIFTSNAKNTTLKLIKT